MAAISPTDYRAVWGATGHDWSQVSQDPTYKALIDAGILKSGTNYGEGGAETQIDWTKMPAITGGLSAQQQQGLGDRGLHFQPVGEGGYQGELYNKDLIFNDPNYGKVTIAGNAKDEKESAFWKIAPMIPMALAMIASGGAAAPALTLFDKVMMQIPNLAKIIGGWNKPQGG